jgi:hypothetical protein
MKPFQRLSHGDERTLTLQLSQIDTMELLDFLRNGEHEKQTENLEVAAIAAKHWLEINHQSIFGKPSKS